MRPGQLRNELALATKKQLNKAGESVPPALMAALDDVARSTGEQEAGAEPEAVAADSPHASDDGSDEDGDGGESETT